jgi:hypothetical protein
MANCMRKTLNPEGPEADCCPERAPPPNTILPSVKAKTHDTLTRDYWSLRPCPEERRFRLLRWLVG